MGKYALEEKHGKKAEDRFEELAIDSGYEVTQSSNYDNMAKHIDFYLQHSKGIECFTVDVKARKKSTRSDSSYNDELVWIEFHNVQGRNGWLYGEADKIAFEREDDFVLIPRVGLAKFCEKAVAPFFVKNSTDAVYKCIQRNGRKDVISKVLMSDIIENVDNILHWKKDVDSVKQAV